MANHWLNDFGEHLPGAGVARVTSTAPTSWELGASRRETNRGGEDGEVWEHRKGAGEERYLGTWLEERGVDGISRGMEIQGIIDEA